MIIWINPKWFEGPVGQLVKKIIFVFLVLMLVLATLNEFGILGNKTDQKIERIKSEDLNKKDIGNKIENNKLMNKSKNEDNQRGIWFQSKLIIYFFIVAGITSFLFRLTMRGFINLLNKTVAIVSGYNIGFDADNKKMGERHPLANIIQKIINSSIASIIFGIIACYVLNYFKESGGIPWLFTILTFWWVFGITRFLVLFKIMFIAICWGGIILNIYGMNEIAANLISSSIMTIICIGFGYFSCRYT